MNSNEREILEMALLGFDQQIANIQRKRFDIEVRLGSTESITEIKPTLVKAHNVYKKRKVSAAGRKRMADAQKARWAKIKKQQRAA